MENWQTKSVYLLNWSQVHLRINYTPIEVANLKMFKNILYPDQSEMELLTW